jgi:hypothetical protein
VNHGPTRDLLIIPTLNRKDCSIALAELFIAAAYQRINRELDSQLREATATTTITTPTSSVVLPSDLGKKVREVLVNGLPIDQRPDRTLAMTYIASYDIREGNVVFNWQLQTGDIVNVVYWRNFTPPTTDTGTNSLLIDAYMLVVLGALSEAGRYFRHERRTEWESDFLATLQSLGDEYADTVMGDGGPMSVGSPYGANVFY